MAMSATRLYKIPEIEYPSSDGKPMAETDAHRNWMLTNINRLERFFAGRKVYVSGNLLIYYVEGNPRKSVAPDAFVVKNCRPRTKKHLPDLEGTPRNQTSLLRPPPNRRARRMPSRKRRPMP